MKNVQYNNNFENSENQYGKLKTVVRVKSRQLNPVGFWLQVCGRGSLSTFGSKWGRQGLDGANLDPISPLLSRRDGGVMHQILGRPAKAKASAVFLQTAAGRMGCFLKLPACQPLAHKAKGEVRAPA